MSGHTQFDRQPVVDEFATESERTYGTFQHLVGLVSLLDHVILGLIGAIVMWRIKHKESPFLDDHGREAVNFQLSLLLYLFAGSIIVGLITFGLGIPLVLAGVAILRLVGCIRGAIAANRGEFYRYPMCIRFIA